MRGFGWALMAFSSVAGAQGPLDERIVVEGLGEIRYAALFEDTSRPAETQDAFVRRIAPRLAAFSQKTGMEACGVIAQQDDQWGIVVGTNHSHIVCMNFPDKVPAGMAATGVTLHSHPQGRHYKVNAADRMVLGKLTALNTQAERGPKGFSAADFTSGPGYLVEGDQVFFQAGPKNIRSVN